MTKPSFQPWWPKGPRNAVGVLAMAMLLSIMLIVAGIFMLFGSREFILPGILAIAFGFLFWAGLYGLQYVLEMLIWQREIAEAREIAEIPENSLERTSHA